MSTSTSMSSLIENTAYINIGQTKSKYDDSTNDSTTLRAYDLECTSTSPTNDMCVSFHKARPKAPKGLFELNSVATTSSLSKKLELEDAGAGLLIMGNASMGVKEFRAYTQNSMMATMLGSAFCTVNGIVGKFFLVPLDEPKPSTESNISPEKTPSSPMDIENSSPSPTNKSGISPPPKGPSQRSVSNSVSTSDPSLSSSPRVGGFYLFDTLDNANAFVDSAFYKSVSSQFPWTGVEVQRFRIRDVMGSGKNGSKSNYEPGAPQISNETNSNTVNSDINTDSNVVKNNPKHLSPFGLERPACLSDYLDKTDPYGWAYASDNDDHNEDRFLSIDRIPTPSKFTSVTSPSSGVLELNADQGFNFADGFETELPTPMSDAFRTPESTPGVGRTGRLEMDMRQTFNNNYPHFNTTGGGNVMWSTEDAGEAGGGGI